MGTKGTLDRYREKYKDAAQGKQTAEIKSRGTLDRYREKYGKVLHGNFKSTVGTMYQQYMDDYQKFATSAAADSKTASYDNARNMLDSRSETASDLRNRASKLALYVHAHKDAMANDDYEAVISNIQLAEREVNKIMDSFGKNVRYYSQWDTKEDYDSFVAQQKDYEEKLSFNLEAGAKEIEQLEAQMDSLDWTQNKDRAKMDELSHVIEQKRQYMEAAQKIQEGERRGIQYTSLMDAADFAEKSQYVSTANGQERSNMDIVMGNYSPESSGWDDPLYEYINGNEEAGAYISNVAASSYGSDNAIGAIFGRATESKAESQRMTKQEVAIFNYLHATQGKEAAHEYYNYLLSDINYRQRKTEEKYWADWAEEDPVGSSVFSVLMSPVKGLSYLGQAADYIGDGEIDQNAAYNKFSYVPGAIRNQVTQQIESSGKWGKVGSFAYQTGMSMGDFLLSTAATGGNQPLALAIMGSGAAADTTIAAKDRGLSDDQAFALGTIAGAAEVLMEKVSLDALFDADLLADGALKYVLKNALAEGSEEVGTDLINTIADVLIAQDKSQWQTAIDAYVAQGKSKSEAFGLALADKAVELGLSGLGGMLSGGILSGVSAGINGSHTSQIGNELAELDLSREDIQAFIQTGLESAPETASHQLAVKLQSKLDAGQELTSNELSRLYQANVQAVAQEQAQQKSAPEIVRTEQASQKTASAVAADTFTSDKKTAQEGGYAASEYGKAYFKNEAVNVMGVASIKDGKMTLKLEDGRTANAEEVEYGSADEALVYETVANMGVNALAANMLIENYTPGGNVSAMVYTKGIEEAYMAGTLNIPKQELSSMPFASMLAGYQQQAAYRMGELFGGKQTAKEQATVRKNRTVQSVDTSKGKVHFGGDRSSLNDTQKASLSVMETVAKALGVQIYVFESKVGEDGKHTGTNGWYDPSDGSIHIDLYAGADGKGTMLFTMAHELTHFIKQWSPAKFKVLANYLMKQYGEKGVSVRELVDNQIAKANRNGRKISYDTAYEEVIADSMETMLTDGNAVQMMADLRQQDRTLWQKIKDWFKDLAEKLKAALDAYKGMSPDSAEGKLVAQMQDVMVILESLYTDALVDASESYNAGAQKNTTPESDVGNDIAIKRSERIVDQIRNSLDKIMALDTVYEIDANNATPFTSDRKTDEKRGNEVFKGQGGVANRPGFGRVVLSKRGAVHTVHHGNGPAKQASFPAIKAVIEKGVEIYRDIDHEGRGFDTVTFSAPIDFFGNPSPLATVVKVFDGANADKAFYIHEICDAEGNYIQFPEESAEEKNSSTNFVEPTSTVSAADNGITPKTSIRNPEPEVKKKFSDRDSEGKQLSEAQQEYFKDSVIRDENGNLMPMYSNRDSDGNQLSKEQQEFFAQSQARDSSGRLLVLYHQTDGDFTIFDTRHPGAGSRDGDTPFGIFLKRTAGDIGLAGKRQMALYANITNPLRAANREDLTRQLREISGNYATISDKHKQLDAEYHEKFEQAKKAWRDYIIEWRAANAGANRSALNDDPKYNELFDAEDAVVDEWTAAADLLSTQAKETITEDLRKAGYDGVFLENDAGSWGRRTDAIIALDPQQVKNISNKTPTNNPDIRHSERDPDYQKANKVLEQENSKLKEDVSYLKELVKLQRQVTGGTKFTKTSVEAAAKNLKQKAGAKGDTKELAGLLNSLYEHIASGKELTWESVKEQAQPAVEWLQSHVNLKQERSEYAQDILNHLHSSRVYLDESQMAEAAYRFGSYNDFRKQLMGSITVAKDANMSLDSLWHEMVALYPSVFDSDTSAADMPGALADIIDTLRNSDTTALEYAHNREMIAQDLLRQVYDSYWTVSTLYTVADKAQKEILALKGKHIQKMAQLREYHQEKTAQLKLEHKERLEKVRQEYRDRAEAKQKKIVERYQESRQKGIEGRRKTEMRHKIQKVVKKLDDLLLNETKDKHVPENLKKVVAQALDAIDMDTVGAEERIAKYDALIAKETDPDVIASLTETRDRIAKAGERFADRIGKLKAAYDSIKGSAESSSISVYDEVIANKIQEVVEQVGSTALREMSYQQLEAVYEMYTMIAKSISNANKSFKEARGATIMQMGNRAMVEIERAGGSNQYALKALKNAKKFGWDLLKPYYAFSVIGSDTMAGLYDNVRKGEDVWAVDVESARQFFRQQAQKHGYDNWDLNEEHTFSDVSGREFKVSLQQIMSLYAYSKREQADKHLEKGGFVFDSAVEVVQKKHGIPVKYLVNTANAYNLSKQQIAEIVGTLSKEQAAFVDAMQDYLSTVMGEKGNEVSLALYDVRLFKEKNYFPLKSASQYTFQQTENTGDVKLKNSGFSKKTVVNASNPIILSDFMDVWGSHVNDMSMYHAFVLPLEDFNRVYNYKTLTSDETSTESVKAALQNAYGVAATKYIKQMLEDINGGARTDDRAGVMNRWMGKFKKGSVFANASVVIQQPSAIARAAALIETRHFVGGKVTQKRHKLLWNEVKQYAPVAIIKEMGYFDTNMGLSTVEYITAKDYDTIGEKARAILADGNYRDELLSRPAALADEISWCYIWDAVKRETKEKHPGMDIQSAAFLNKAGERFTEVVTRTQVYDSVLSRSGLMRSKDTGVKMMTAFMSEPTTSMNMVFDALIQGKRGDRRYARGAVGAVIASQILNSLLVSIVYAARDDDEDKTYLEKYLANFTAKTLDSLNPLSYLPFIKDIVSIARGYTVERSDMSVISDIWTAWQKLPNENVSLYRKIEDFGGSIAQAFGLPVKNIMRDVRSIYQTTQSFLSGKETTALGVGVAIWDEVTGKGISKQRRLYEAIVNGDTEYRERIAATYDDEATLESAIRKGLREYDARISEAAEARYNGDFDEYERIFDEIEREGNFSHSQIAGAIQAELNDMDESDSGASTPKQYGMYTMDDFMLAVAAGESKTLGDIRDEILQTAQENGKTKEQAQNSFVSSVVSACKEQYLAGSITEKQTISVLVKYCNRSEDEARADVSYWTYKQKHPDTEATAQWFDTYYEKIEGTGIDLDAYVEYRNRKTEYTKKVDILQIIDGMPLTNKQKDALYYAEGWAESTLDEAPWH